METWNNSITYTIWYIYIHILIQIHLWFIYIYIYLFINTYIIHVLHCVVPYQHFEEWFAFRTPKKTEEHILQSKFHWLFMELTWHDDEVTLVLAWRVIIEKSAMLLSLIIGRRPEFAAALVLKAGGGFENGCGASYQYLSIQDRNLSSLSRFIGGLGSI